MTKTVNFAIYCRSAVDNKEGITTQEKQLRKHVVERGGKIVGVYKDNGRSGLSLDHPALSKLRRDARTGKFSWVLAVSPERLTRDHMHFLELMQELGEIGVNLSFASNSEDDKSSTGHLVRMILKTASSHGGRVRFEFTD